jgi:hypothetical protein
VDTIQGTLGQALLVVIAVAVLLSAVILVLVEADYILGRLEKLARRLQATAPGPTNSEPPASDQTDAERPNDGQGVQ